jgi:hypothetical protein
MWFLLVMELLSRECWQQRLTLWSQERFAIFSPPWLLPTLDPRLIDVCLYRRGVRVTCLEFVRVASWSLVLASVGVTMLFGSLLGLILLL